MSRVNVGRRPAGSVFMRMHDCLMVEAPLSDEVDSHYGKNAAAAVREDLSRNGVTVTEGQFDSLGWPAI
ncbi:MAG TPA: hypothetical protein VMU47_23715 [Caldimonas sp.]|nr:hypothetical protein [Caldimonas sp.]